MAPNSPKSDLSDDGEALLTVSEVASLDNVTPKTVVRRIKKACCRRTSLAANGGSRLAITGDFGENGGTDDAPI